MAEVSVVKWLPRVLPIVPCDRHLVNPRQHTNPRVFWYGEPTAVYQPVFHDVGPTADFREWCDQVQLEPSHLRSTYRRKHSR
jgi:hypothetical protein